MVSLAFQNNEPGLNLTAASSKPTTEFAQPRLSTVAAKIITENLFTKIISRGN